MEEMDVAQTFNVALHVPVLRKEEMRSVLGQLGAFAGQDVSLLYVISWLLISILWVVSNFVVLDDEMLLQLDVAVQEVLDGIPIKRLLLLLDLARQGLEEEQTAVPIATWTKVIQDLGLG